jgi:hypothetical protein
MHSLLIGNTGQSSADGRARHDQGVRKAPKMHDFEGNGRKISAQDCEGIVSNVCLKFVRFSN